MKGAIVGSFERGLVAREFEDGIAVLTVADVGAGYVIGSRLLYLLH